MDSKIPTLPMELEIRLQKQLGVDFEAFMDALIDDAPTSIRLNPGKLNHEIQFDSPVPWCPQGKYLRDRPRFTSDPLYHAGSYYVQEASSMFLCFLLEQVVDLSQRIRVLDLSASPGGKSTLLQSLITPDSLLVANEVITGRNKILRHNLARWGNDNYVVTQSDPRFFSKLPDFFDLILVDAPCSGEGLIRKDPAAINEWSQQNVNLCASRQKRILSDVVPALAPGGIMIYSTCTFSEDENEENMTWLMEQKDLTPIPIKIPAEFGVVKTGVSNAGYRFYPHRLRGEGFFIAAFKKAGNPSRSPGHKAKDRINSSHFTASTDEDEKWLNFPSSYLFENRDEHRTAIPRSIYNDYLVLSQALRVTYAGIYLGKVYHSALKPSPELALNQSLNSSLPRVELSAEHALDYLAHMHFSLNPKLAPGYYLITHSGFGLGWIHVLNTGQIRNKYPSAWRILQRHPKTKI